jgi:hypothetical protein
MTDGRPPADWSDERLAAAFQDRASGRPTPVHLASTTMDRVGRGTRERRTQPRLLWAGALAAVIAVAVISTATLLQTGRPTPDRTEVAASTGSPTVEPTPSTRAASPKTIALQYTVGAHRVAVEVVDGSGRLIAARTTTSADDSGLMPHELRAAAVEGKPDQLRIEWIGGACDGTLRLTIADDVRTVDATTVSGTLDPEMFCPLGGSPRGVVLTFDGPVAANEVAIVGDSPLPVLEPVGSTWVGEPISVAEAIEHRNYALDDTELAIKGWAWQPALVASCTLQLPGSPVRAGCGDNIRWISDGYPEAATTGPFAQPPPPALQLLVRQETYAQIPLPPQPAQVIVMGHFDDHRAAACPPGQFDVCRQNFVVDAILDPEAPAIDRDAINALRLDPDAHPTASPAEVARAATGRSRGADFVLVVSALRGETIGQFEPAAAAFPKFSEADVVWLVRYLDQVDSRRVITTALVIDGPPESLTANVSVISKEPEIRR